MFIPTQNDCDQIVKNNEAFMKKTVTIDGYPITIYNYRLASLNDFVHPISDNDDIDAFELRGISFTHFRNARYLMLNKW